MSEFLIIKNIEKHIALSDKELEYLTSRIAVKSVKRKELTLIQEIQYPTAHRLLTKCDAVLRIEGASKGADQDVEVAKKLGLKIYYSLSEIPDIK